MRRCRKNEQKAPPASLAGSFQTPEALSVGRCLLSELKSNRFKPNAQCTSRLKSSCMQTQAKRLDLLLQTFRNFQNVRIKRELEPHLIGTPHSGPGKTETGRELCRSHSDETVKVLVLKLQPSTFRCNFYNVWKERTGHGK